MDKVSGEKRPIVPVAREESEPLFKTSQTKDELYAYIQQSPGEVPSLLHRKVIPQHLVDAEFLNRLATGKETHSLKMFLGYAKESLVHMGLTSILKGANAESALLVIDSLKTIPPRAPFTLFSNFAKSDPNGCLKILALLVEKGWNPQSVNENGETVLDLAAKLGYKPNSPFYQALLELQPQPKG